MSLRTALATLLLAIHALVQTAPAKPQPWQMQTSNSTASLRGVHSIGDGKVAWASGSEGTVLRTEDGGSTWQKCAAPGANPAGANASLAGAGKIAAKLDFRGNWAFDAKTAIVMSSGPGDGSRIYKTKDGCRTWTLKYTNPEEKGFWDTIVFLTEKQGFVLGDPVDGAFRIYTTRDQGETWFLTDDAGLKADPKLEGAFAASNTALSTQGGAFWFGSGGKAGAHVSRSYAKCPAAVAASAECPMAWDKVAVPMAGGTEGAGVFSVGSRTVGDGSGKLTSHVVAVGGNYEKPAETAGTAAYSLDGGITWAAAAVPPHGYRSAVEWDAKNRVWIAAGTNGSDFSRDDGKTWQPLDDGAWNALSLPYVVGPRGQIARLMDGAIPAQ